jgi:hypothetical protein
VHRSATLGTELLADTLGSVVSLVSLAKVGSVAELALGLVALQLLLLCVFAYTLRRWFNPTFGDREGAEAARVEIIPLAGGGVDLEAADPSKAPPGKTTEELVGLGTLARSLAREHYWLGSAMVIQASAAVAAVIV